MKALDVSLFHEAIGRNISMLRRVGNDMDTIRVAIEGFVALEDALKGKMGQAMRSFYAECHLPFLQFHATFNEKLIDTLERMGTPSIRLNQMHLAIFVKIFWRNILKKV